MEIVRKGECQNKLLGNQLAIYLEAWREGILAVGEACVARGHGYSSREGLPQMSSRNTDLKPVSLSLSNSQKRLVHKVSVDRGLLQTVEWV